MGAMSAWDAQGRRSRAVSCVACSWEQLSTWTDQTVEALAAVAADSGDHRVVTLTGMSGDVPSVHASHGRCASVQRWSSTVHYDRWYATGSTQPRTLVAVHVQRVRRPNRDVGQQAEAVGAVGVVLAGDHTNRAWGHVELWQQKGSNMSNK